MTTREKILQEIERYLRRSGMTATKFGIVVLNNSRFVHDLRKGSAIKDYTIDRVRDWIRANPPAPRPSHRASARAAA